MSSGAASSVTSSLNCLPRPATTDLETLNQLLSSSPSTLGTAFSFHSFQGLPRYGMQPSSMPPGPGLVGENWITHAATGDPSSGTGSLSSRGWQDAPSLATTLTLSRRESPSLGSRLGVGMRLARDERMPASVRGCGMSWAGDSEASRNCFSPLLTVTDSASVVTHTEPRDDFDDCGLDVCPGNPDM